MTTLFEDDFTTGTSGLNGRTALTGQLWVEDTPSSISCDATGAFVVGASNRKARAATAVAGNLDTSIEYVVTNSASTASWSASFGLVDGAGDLLGLEIDRFAGTIQVYIVSGEVPTGEVFFDVAHSFAEVSSETHTYRMDYAGGNVSVFFDDVLVYGPSAAPHPPTAKYPYMRIQNAGSGASNQVKIRSVLVDQGEPVGFWTDFVRTAEIA